MNLRRKIQHIASGLLLVYLHAALAREGRWSSGVSLLAASGTVFVLHHLRVRVPAMQRTVMQVFGPILRAYEVNSLPSAFWLLFGCGVTALLFGSEPPAAGVCAHSAPVDIPALCLLVLTLGDPFASIFGIIIGRRDTMRVYGKSIIASLMAALLAAAACFAYLHGTVTPFKSTSSACGASSAAIDSAACGLGLSSYRTSLVAWSALASVIGLAFEFAPMSIDDNFRVPIGTGFVLFAARYAGLMQDPTLLNANCA
jgi:dolichol kinase